MNAVTDTRIRAIVQSAECEHDLRTALAGITHFETGIRRGTLHERQTDRLLPHDILIADIDLDDPEDMAALEQLLSGDEHPTVIVTSSNVSVEAMRRLIRLGVADYLPQPISRNELVSVIRSVRARGRAGADKRAHHCPVVTFVRRSGGMGATSLAIQTAYELARGRRGRPKRRVCLVDLDFQSGAAWLHLDAEPLLDIAEIVRSPHRLDTQLLTAMTTHHSAGFDLIASPNGSIHPDQVPGDVVSHMMALICESYDCVVVDLPISWNRWMGEVLAGSDKIFLTLQLTVVAVKQAHLFLELIKGTAAGQIPLSVVLNRHRRSWWRPGLKTREVERALGHKVDVSIASDYKLFSGAADHGTPIGKFGANSRAEQQISKMIQATLKEIAAAQTAK